MLALTILLIAAAAVLCLLLARYEDAHERDWDG